MLTELLRHQRKQPDNAAALQVTLLTHSSEMKKAGGEPSSPPPLDYTKCFSDQRDAVPKG